MKRYAFNAIPFALLMAWGLCLPARAQDTFGLGPANGGSVTAGTPFTLAVTVLSPSDPATIATGYGDPVSFSSTDPSASLPATTGFNTWSTGVSTFTATLFLASPPATTSISVTDTADFGINGSATFTVLPASPTQFIWTTPSLAVQGTAFPVSVEAKDAYGNIASNFNGPDSLTGSDAGAVFTGASWNGGLLTFSAVLNTVGSQVITITNTSNASSGTSNAINVISPTPTATFTYTFTGTPTATFTHTATVPFTATFTSPPTSTPTIALPVYTDTPTNTPTVTLTFLPLLTPTPTPQTAAPTDTPALASITTTPTPNVPLYLDSNFFNPQQNPLGMDVRVYQNGQVKLEVFNMAGERVRNIANQTLQQGNYRFYWDGLNDSGAVVGNGVYYMVIQTPAGTKVQKVILLK